MKKPLRTYLLVRARLDANDVPYLVADPTVPARRVGIRHAEKVPERLDHFAEHFEPHAHVVDASDMRHLAHYRKNEQAGCLEILGQCLARDASDALTKLSPPPAPLAPSPSAQAPASASNAAPKPSPIAAPAAE